MSDRLRSLSSFADSFINWPLLSARNLLDFCAILGEWNVNFLSGGPFVFVLHFNVTGRLAAVKMDAGIPSVVYDPAHQQHVLLLFLYLFFFLFLLLHHPRPPLASSLAGRYRNSMVTDLGNHRPTPVLPGSALLERNKSTTSRDYRLRSSRSRSDVKMTAVDSRNGSQLIGKWTVVHCSK